MINGNAREVRVPIVIRGTGIGRGVAIGPLRFGSLRGESLRRRTVREVEKLKAASDTVKEELSVMEARSPSTRWVSSSSRASVSVNAT